MSIIRTILLPKINIQNANALSSPYTVGFPAMSAWLGFMHAMQRKLREKGVGDIELLSLAVSSHKFNLQTYKGDSDFVYSIIGTANPLEKDGARGAFIEEPRCHLEVSLLLEFQGDEDKIDTPEGKELIGNLLATMKIAGGDILSFQPPEISVINDNDDRSRNSILRRLMPGYVLVERRELMQESMQEGMDAIDAMLPYLTVHHSSVQLDNEQVEWRSQRKVAGWVVPISVGFHGISALDTALNQRDPNTPHRFAESLVTLGEFVMPHRVKSLDDMFWHHHFEPNNNLYICQQNNKIESN
jgi:CRISPR-associated protein Csy2